MVQVLLYVSNPIIEGQEPVQSQRIGVMDGIKMPRARKSLNSFKKLIVINGFRQVLSIAYRGTIDGGSGTDRISM